jgi:hypothetical protein
MEVQWGLFEQYEGFVSVHAELCFAAGMLLASIEQAKPLCWLVNLICQPAVAKAGLGNNELLHSPAQTACH